MKLAIRGGSWLGADQAVVRFDGKRIRDIAVHRQGTILITFNHPHLGGLQQLSEERSSSFGKKFLAGAAGGFALGPAGLLAGALVAGNKKNWLAHLSIKDGRELVLECSPDEFKKLWAGLA